MSSILELRTAKIYAEMIKLAHSVFALPFAMIGMLWAANGWPETHIIIWILIAMISCRSAAMTYNRIVDRDVDALNPRTANRALPSGLLRLNQVTVFYILNCLIFLFSTAMINTLTFTLSPIALLITQFYSKTKRFTPLCHFFLGASLAIAPAATWVSIRGSLNLEIVPLCLSVMFWTAGMDILYSLLDEEFDKNNGLRSIPETFGKTKALWGSKLCHLISIGFLFLSGMLVGAGMWYYLGIFIAGLLLIYEQSLVKPDDLSKVNTAFFTLNGFISIETFTFTYIDYILK